MGIISGIMKTVEVGGIVGGQLKERAEVKKIKKKFDEILKQKGPMAACGFLKDTLKEIKFEPSTGEKPELSFIIKILNHFVDPALNDLEKISFNVNKLVFDNVFKTFKKDFFGVFSVLNFETENGKNWVSKRGMPKFQNFIDSFNRYIDSLPIEK